MYAHASTPDAGIKLDPACISNGSCTLEIYETLQLRTDTQGQNTPQNFVQDLFLGATFFIGTLATFGLVISGMMMVFGGASEGMYEKGKKGFQYSIIGIILVIMSYTMIRAVQYVAQGNQ